MVLRRISNQDDWKWYLFAIQNTFLQRSLVFLKILDRCDSLASIDVNTDDGQSSIMILFMNVDHAWQLRYASSTPISPEIEKHYIAFEVVQRSRSSALPGDS